MADSKAEAKTETFPQGNDVLGTHDIFRQLTDETRGPVKSLNEAGWTKIVLAYQDRKGVMHSQTVLVTHEICDQITALLHEEQLG